MPWRTCPTDKAHYAASPSEETACPVCGAALVEVENLTEEEVARGAPIATSDPYLDFLAAKAAPPPAAGFVSPHPINPLLFPWQADTVRWALERGRAALFEDCGLGKGPQGLEWAHHVSLHTG